MSEGRAGAAREHAAVAANARKGGPAGARRAAPSNLSGHAKSQFGSLDVIVQTDLSHETLLEK